MTDIAPYVSHGAGLVASVDTKVLPFAEKLEVKTTILEARHEVNPTVSSLANAKSDGGICNLEFNIQSTNDSSMYDLRDSYFQFAVNISNISTNASVGFAHFGVQNMIRDFQAYFGSVLVSEPHSGDVYRYQALVDTILQDDHPGWLSTINSNSVNAGGFSNVKALTETKFLSHPYAGMSVSVNANPGVSFWNVLISNNTIYVKFRPIDGIFKQESLYPSSINLRFTMQINVQNLFCEPAASILISGGGAFITEANLYLKRVFLTMDAQKAQAKAFGFTPAGYILPYSKVETRVVPQGVSSFAASGLFQSQLKPDLVAIFFQGSPGKDISKVSLSASVSPQVTITSLYTKFNGVQYPSPTEGPLRLDIRGYQAYLDECNVDSKDAFLDYYSWLKNFAVMIVNLRPDNEKMYGLAPSAVQGGLEIFTTFSTATSSQCTLYVVALTHVRLTIGSRGDVNKFGYIN